MSLELDLIKRIFAYEYLPYIFIWIRLFSIDLEYFSRI